MNVRCWDWMGRAWKYPEVRTLFLELQEAEGTNIVLAMGVLYLGLEGVVVDEGWFEAAKARISVWQEDVILPLRATRDRWASTAGSAHPDRNGIQKILLEAEKYLLDQLLSVLPATHAPAGPELAIRNLSLLGGRLADPDVHRRILPLL